VRNALHVGAPSDILARLKVVLHPELAQDLN
jgi:hypothetical protein